ncbi:helicase associated domain-containing protein [Streptomyces sp. DH10]|uniref:helicase associated domain-containing protein n=1 Tax=Streptomyces sp. DH10 TaxID=3040121 RepID=UPI002442C555|nr:helicase associated domain-containing protein [Streptomyces sp. DH10]MDG9709364.1 helicase associated domain-containing protein [Streptomyces sp. DH10]
MDVGRWLQRQRQHTIWHGLKDGQRLLLEQLGVTPLPPEMEHRCTTIGVLVTPPSLPRGRFGGRVGPGRGQGVSVLAGGTIGLRTDCRMAKRGSGVRNGQWLSTANLHADQMKA